VNIQEDTPPPFIRLDDTSPQHPIDIRESGALPPRVARRGGLGCWIPGILTLLLVTALVVIGAILPPVNLPQRLLGVSLFGPNYTMLRPDANAVAADGLAVVADPAQLSSEFGVALASVPVDATTTDDAIVAEALAAVPPGLSRQSPVYSILTTGQQPETMTLSVTVPAGANPDLLDLYGWDIKTKRWTFIPAQINRAGALTMIASVTRIPTHIALFQASSTGQPVVVVAIDTTQKFTDEAGQLATIVSPAGMQPTLDGRLIGSLAPGYDLNKGYLVMPVIRNFTDPRAVDTNTITAILGNSTLRGQHAAQIAVFAANNGFEGVFVDYRDVPPEQRDPFSALVTELGKNLNQQGLKLGVVVPAADNTNGAWTTGAYDWRVIGAAADYLQIDLSLNPTFFASGVDQPVESLLRWAVGEVARPRIILELSALSVRQVGMDYTSVGYSEALSALGDVKLGTQVTQGGTIPPGSEISARLDGFSAVSGLDTTIETPFIDYLDADGKAISRIWLTTGDALRFRMERVAPFSLAGVAFSDLVSEGVAEGIIGAILGYKLQTPTQQQATELALRWRIESASGVLSEVTTGLNDSLVTTLEAPEGNYAINVEVVGGDSPVSRSGVAVALFAPTPTPTPLPTPTPTPIPTATPPPAAVQPASAGATGGAVNPGAGSITVGNFEYGGHVTNPGSDAAAGAMRRAGMNWMKVQIRYSAGMQPGVAASQINDAHSRGFKILIGLVGNPGELGAGGQSYVQQFASFAGGVAGLGPDAIEVWNEPNIDREWPAGQISGANYAGLLQQTYQAIKGANGGVLVISGAPAPTGAEAAFPGRVVNDDRFLRDLVAAGGLQWMDCLGAHYNEGIVSPTQSSGDPRDNYYTRYFGTMLDTYWNISGGQKPICWTELGYLTPEGYGALDPFFGWAQNTTVAQQAAWLAQAAALSSQSGKVRLMIVWNVDFSSYGSDPMAGYAMIRPGGGCPACDAMAGAR
jgi:spore germination protein YaaH